jgi:hypothetical protein
MKQQERSKRGNYLNLLFLVCLMISDRRFLDRYLQIDRVRNSQKGKIVGPLHWIMEYEILTTSLSQLQR